MQSQSAYLSLELNKFKIHSNMSKKKVISRRSVAFGLSFFAARVICTWKNSMHGYMFSKSGNRCNSDQMSVGTETTLLLSIFL